MMYLKLLFFFTLIGLWGDESFAMRFLSYEKDKNYYIGEIYRIGTDKTLPPSYFEQPDFQNMLFKDADKGAFRYDNQKITWNKKSFLVPLNVFHFSVGAPKTETVFSGKLTKTADELHLDYDFKDKKEKIALQGSIRLSLLKIYFLGGFHKEFLHSR